MYMNGQTQHPIQHVHSTQAHLETKSRHTRIRAPAARFRVFSSKYLSTCTYYAIVTNIGGNSEKNSHDSLAKYSSALWQHLLVSTRKKLLRARERMLD